VKSRIQLLATRLRLTPEDARLREQLKQALLEQVDLRVRLLKQEHQKMAERLKRLDEQIKAMAAERERYVEKQFQMLVRIPQKKPPLKQKPHEAVKENPKRPAKDKDDGRRKTDKPVSRSKESKTG
jgi:hypothetical protein